MKTKALLAILTITGSIQAFACEDGPSMAEDAVIRKLEKTEPPSVVKNCKAIAKDMKEIPSKGTSPNMELHLVGVVCRKTPKAMNFEVKLIEVEDAVCYVKYTKKLN